MGVSLASDLWIHVEIKIHSIYKIHFQQSKKYFFASFYFFSCNGMMRQVLVTLICTTHMITVSTYYLWLTDLTGISCNFNLTITVKRWKSKSIPLSFQWTASRFSFVFKKEDDPTANFSFLNAIGNIPRFTRIVPHENLFPVSKFWTRSKVVEKLSKNKK